MPTHWTYQDCADDPSLNQGDFLFPTPKLQKIFEEVHPHFMDPKYMGFLVTTQTCDVIRRRDNPPKAPYISVAVVRPLASVLYDLFSHVGKSIATGVFLKSSRQQCADLCERIYNQNEQSLGLFYLHPDADVGIGVPSVAMLRVTVALKPIHYSVLVDARRGRLLPEFQSKLGWMIGNLYSRAAVTDWHEQDAGALEGLVRETIDGSRLKRPIAWVDDEMAESARKADFNLEALDPEGAMAALEAFRPKPLPERLAEACVTALQQVVLGINRTNPGGEVISNEVLDAIQSKLKNRLVKGGAIQRELRRRS